MLKNKQFSSFNKHDDIDRFIAIIIKIFGNKIKSNLTYRNISNFSEEDLIAYLREIQNLNISGKYIHGGSGIRDIITSTNTNIIVISAVSLVSLFENYSVILDPSISNKTSDMRPLIASSTSLSSILLANNPDLMLQLEIQGSQKSIEPFKNC